MILCNLRVKILIKKVVTDGRHFLKIQDGRHIGFWENGNMHFLICYFMTSSKICCISRKTEFPRLRLKFW